jgi:hypothetical protein
VCVCGSGKVVLSDLSGVRWVYMEWMYGGRSGIPGEAVYVCGR